MPPSVLPGKAAEDLDEPSGWTLSGRGPDGNWSRPGIETYAFTALPVGESPVLIADRSLIALS